VLPELAGRNRGIVLYFCGSVYLFLTRFQASPRHIAIGLGADFGASSGRGRGNWSALRSGSLVSIGVMRRALAGVP
jgi:hypothetical protein